MKRLVLLFTAATLGLTFGRGERARKKCPATSVIKGGFEDIVSMF